MTKCSSTGTVDIPWPTGKSPFLLLSAKEAWKTAKCDDDTDFVVSSSLEGLDFASDSATGLC